MPSLDLISHPQDSVEVEHTESKAHTSSHETNQEENVLSSTDEESDENESLAATITDGATPQGHDFQLYFCIDKIIKGFKNQLFPPPDPPKPAKYCRPMPRILLYGMESIEQHWDEIYRVMNVAGKMKGKEGLDLIGLEYQRVYNLGHGKETVREKCHDGKVVMKSDFEFSPQYTTELFHKNSNTKITIKNRQKFIADGEMYELVVRLAQEYAQDLMIKEGDLEWRDVCEEERSQSPIKVLVSKCLTFPLNRKQNERKNGVVNTNEKMILITTGKGKVRGGIFSRQHLLISSIESATALPMVIDARARGMKIAILDPNVRGDRYGMSTFEQSMGYLFGCVDGAVTLNSKGDDLSRIENVYGSSKSCALEGLGSSLEDDGDSMFANSVIYALIHSASGSQLLRYLKEKGGHLIPRIKSLAFTDSTHSIQWIKNDPLILSLFQSEKSLYIRSSNEDHDYNWERHEAGDMCECDEYWKHRFGTIRTIWAGTKDHSLSNWTAHNQIWQHFDNHNQN